MSEIGEGGGVPFCFFICSLLYLFACLFLYILISLFFYLFVLSFFLSLYFFCIFLAPAFKLFRVTLVNKLHLHFIFTPSNSVFRGCSVVFRCSGLPGFSTCCD